MSTPANQRLYVQAALFCERVLTEEGGVVSLMRVVDTGELKLPRNFSFTPVVELEAVVMLKSEEPGTYRVEIIGQSPSGKKIEVGEPTVVTLPGNGGGFNIRVQMKFGVREFGLSWFDVIADGEVLTRMPLTLRRIEPSEPSSPKTSE